MSRTASLGWLSVMFGVAALITVAPAVSMQPEADSVVTLGYDASGSMGGQHPGAATEVEVARAASGQDALPLVSATFRVPDTFPPTPLWWSAIPLDPGLPPEAWAPITEMIVAEGEFEPGRYEVSALAPGEVVFKGIVEIVPGQANEFVIALDESQAMFDDTDGFVEPAVAVCTDQPSGCPFSDPDTGLSLIIPDGWSMTQPFVYQTAAGVSASVASATLFRGRDGGVVELNPRQWTSMLGDCVDAGAHRICYGDTIDADLRAALAVLQRSLGQIDP